MVVDHGNVARNFDQCFTFTVKHSFNTAQIQ